MKKLLIAMSAAAAVIVLMVVTVFVAMLPGLFPQQRGGATLVGCTLTATGQLTAAQVAAYAYAGGFSDSVIDKPTGDPVLVVAVAITKPESGADTSAVQPDQAPDLTGEGLWQVTPPEPNDLDPLQNTKDAYAKWQGAGDAFTPWTTYVAGDELAYISWAEQGVQQFLSSGACKSSGGLAAGTPGSVGQAVQQPTPSNLPTPSFDGFPFGQCTYWAAYEWSQIGRDVSWSGNAWEWYPNASAAGHPETPSSGTPAVDDIVVWSSDYPGSDGYGHVAVITAVGSGTFTVTEMNYLGTGVVDSRTDTDSDPYVAGYIDG